MAITVPVDIDFQIKKALDDANDLADVANRSLAGIEKKAKQTGFAINSIAFVEITRAAIDFGRVIVDVFSKAIDEAIEADEAVQGLSSSLKSAGDFSEQNVAAFEDLAESLSEVSRFSDEAVLGAFRIGKQFGLTNRETAKFGKAAVELATFLGQDLDTTARQLGQTFDGTAGRLAEQVPALKSVSAAALKAGGALDVVIKAAGGAGQRDLDKFGTQILKLQQAFGDIFEELGAAIVQNPAVVDALKIITSLFKEIGTAVGENNEIFKSFITGSLSVMVKSLFVISEILNAVNSGLYKLAKGLDLIIQPLEAFDKATEALKKGDIRGFTRSLDIVTATRDRFKEIDKLAERDAKIFEKFNAALSHVQGAIDRAGTAQKKTSVEIIKGFDNQINKNKRILETEEEKIKLMKEQIQLQEEFFKKRDEELKRRVSEPFSGLVPKGTNLLGATTADQDAIATGVGVATSAISGRQGAVTAVSGVAEAAGRALLGVPGFGELTKMLSQGPEATKAFVKEFIRAVPDIIDAIVESIPEVIDAFIEELPYLLERLVQSLPKILVSIFKSSLIVKAITAMFSEGFKDAVSELINGAGRFIEELVNGVGRFIEELVNGVGRFIEELVNGAGRFIEELVNGAGRFIEELVNGAGKFIEELANKIGEAIQGLIDDLNPAKGVGETLGGIGGSISSTVVGPVGDFIGAVGGVFGFKGGGGGGGQQAAVVKVQIGQRDLATAILDLNRQGFRTT